MVVFGGKTSTTMGSLFLRCPYVLVYLFMFYEFIFIKIDVRGSLLVYEDILDGNVRVECRKDKLKVPCGGPNR